jgi:hypothetical protein
MIFKYRAFSGYFSPKLCPEAGFALDFLEQAVRASTLNSLSFWFSAVNSTALNFVQHILIVRLSGTLAVADSSWAVKVEHIWGFKYIERLPSALRLLIVVTSALNILARSAELLLSVLVAVRVTAYIGNATIYQPVLVLQVCR